MTETLPALARNWNGAFLQNHHHVCDLGARGLDACLAQARAENALLWGMDVLSVVALILVAYGVSRVVRSTHVGCDVPCGGMRG